MLTTIAFGASSCSPKRSAESEALYGGSTRDSLFVSLRKEGGIRFCYWAPDFRSESEAQNVYRQYRAYVEQAVYTWLAPVKREKSWTIENVSLSSEFSYRCNSGSNVVKIALYKDNSNFQAMCLKRFGPEYHSAMQKKCRSMVSGREMFLNMSDDLKDDKVYPVEAVILHEVGHLFGMADTYREAGDLSDKGGAFQPGGTVMKYSTASTVLAKDDEAGIVAIWNSVRQGNTSLQCGPGYRGFHRDSFGTVYCIPAKTNTSPRANPEQKGELDPKAAAMSFDCIEDKAMQGAWMGCIELLKWRAEKTGRAVNRNLSADDLLGAVRACTNVAGDSQFSTCTRKLLTCVSSQWSTDDYACFASGGGNACFETCK
jgi:hypothetical protein